MITDCFQYNIFLCSKLCEFNNDFDTIIKYEHRLKEMKQKISNNITIFIINSLDNKIVAMKNAIKILEDNFSVQGFIFITIYSLMRSLLFKYHS